MKPHSMLAVSVLLATALACVHAGQPAANAAAAPAKTEIVTGSHVPQRVDPRTGLPERSAWVRTYTSEDLALSGHTSLGAAIHQLEPADDSH